MENKPIKTQQKLRVSGEPAWLACRFARQLSSANGEVVRILQCHREHLQLPVARFVHLPAFISL